MDRCPVELLLEIASFACTDGGATGCALSSVSQYIRGAVEPARYQSIALRGFKKTLRFLDVLQHKTKPPRVEHMLFSVLGAPYIQCRASSQVLAQMTEDERTEAMQVYVIILTQLAPTLRTLFLHDDMPFLLDGVGTRFPALQVLSITSPLSTAHSLVMHGCSSLKRLHISNIQSLSNEFWEALALATPSLSHLRLSGVRQDPHISHFLKVFLRVSNEKEIPSIDQADTGEQANPGNEYQVDSIDEETVAEIALKLPDLRNIYVLPVIATSMYWESTSRRMHSAMVRGLRDLADETGRGAGVGRLHLLPETGGYGLLEARRHWLDVVNGGNGPWEHDPPAGWADAVLAQSMSRSLAITA